MKIAVCVKQIPDPATPYELDPDTHFVARPEDQVLDDTDRYGIEVGLQLSDAAGDDALRRVADACRGVVREADSVGRIGGEEFAFLLPETDCSLAIAVAERLRQTIASEVWLGDDARMPITVSIGVAAIHPDHLNVEDMIADADLALYEAKRGGRNKVVQRRAA